MSEKGTAANTGQNTELWVMKFHTFMEPQGILNQFAISGHPDYLIITKITCDVLWTTKMHYINANYHYY